MLVTTARVRIPFGGRPSATSAACRLITRPSRAGCTAAPGRTSSRLIAHPTPGSNRRKDGHAPRQDCAASPGQSRTVGHTSSFAERWSPPQPPHGKPHRECPSTPPRRFPRSQDIPSVRAASRPVDVGVTLHVEWLPFNEYWVGQAVGGGAGLQRRCVRAQVESPCYWAAERAKRISTSVRPWRRLCVVWLASRWISGMPSPSRGCAEGWSLPHAPVRDADHDLVIRRLALALNVARAVLIGAADDVRARLRHRKLDIRGAAPGQAPADLPSPTSAGRVHPTRCVRRPVRQRVPSGRHWVALPALMTGSFDALSASTRPAFRRSVEAGRSRGVWWR